ncbi:type II toxin-antitoxin system Phd/YefM family antitoxin [Massilia sp. RP-1-19]|uniref:Antitoxin n=1 Tax=Massilia polaris TaxID=2728846 RepID=A0A848HWM3_9BURK|nr:type II toxin-antitoxin system prevent-host-death family antitoxin [Massilia polaris]NML63138.1 type II toxin-antitoxin system Phd/YefM family antitoxin [Massilia polaris]
MGTVTTLNGREFNQNTSEAKKAAEKSPVFITDLGRPTHVLLSIEDYQRLEGWGRKITDLLYMEGVAEIELEMPTFPDVAVAADLS